MKNRRVIAGFTLIELLVVIAIIALLLSILIPGLKSAKDIAKRMVCAGRLRQVGVAMSNYSKSFEYLPDAEGEFGHGFAVYRIDMTGGGKPLPLRWAKLYEGGYMDVPESFYCPGNRLDVYKYESYVNPAPWGTLPQVFNNPPTWNGNQWVRVGYIYFPLTTGIPKWTGGRLELAKKFVQLHPSLPYATDIIGSRSSLSHQRLQDSSYVYNASNKYSVNALYSDAHVSNCNDSEVFKNKVWDDFESSHAYDDFYLAVFKLIGSR